MGQLSLGSIISQQLKSGLISFSDYREYKKAKVLWTRENLHDYQRLAYDFIMDHPYCALFIDLGLGKTITSLTALVDLLMDFEIKKGLVIAPRRVANKTWPDEIADWSHTSMFEYTVISGNPEERARKCRSSSSIHIISRDNIEWLVEFYKRDWPYDMVIIDESSSFKDHKTKRFKALRNVRRYIKRMVQLTATPCAETYMHLFAQVFLLDEGTRLGKTITGYQNTYFNSNKWSHKFTLREGAREIITQKISDLCLVMKAEDYLDMAKPVFVNRKVELNEAQTKQYLEMEKDMIIEVYGDDLEPVTVEAESAATLSGKLLQMCSGVVYNSYFEGLHPKTGKPVKKTDVYELHDAKLDMLEDIVESCEGKNILVGYHFKSSLARLKKRFPKAVQMDAEGECVTKWNQGKIKMLLAHPQSAGHGLNLQKGGHTIVFFDIPWSLELYLQFIGRLQRQGQKDLVTVYHLIAEGIKTTKKGIEIVPTLDGGVVEALRRKEDGQEWLLQQIMKVRNRAAAARRRAAQAA